MSNVTQEDIEIFISKCKSYPDAVGLLSEEQIKKVPDRLFEGFTPPQEPRRRLLTRLDKLDLQDEFRKLGYSDFEIKGGEIPPETFKQVSSKFVASFPQTKIDEFISQGGNFDEYISEEQLKNVPQKVWINNFANGGDFYLKRLTKEERKDLPQDLIVSHILNGGNYYYFKGADFSLANKIDLWLTRRCPVFTKEEEENLPKQLISPNSTMKDAVILYASGHISKEQIPLDCFGNPTLRNTLFSIVEHDANEAFETYCRACKFEKIPDDVKDVYNQKISEIKKEFEGKKKECLEKTSLKMIEKNEENSEKITKNRETIKDKIMEWNW